MNISSPPQSPPTAAPDPQSTLGRPAALRIAIAWSAAAREVDLGDSSRAQWSAAARRAIRRCVRQVPFENDASKYFEGGEVSVSFVTDAEIAVLNAQYRGKNRPTDVLSWAQNEGEEFPDWPASFPEEAEEEASALLGDIVLSVETTLRQARERGHWAREEVEFLAVHGTLHLLGYDHQTGAARRAMWKLQDRIIGDLAPGISLIAR